MRTKGWNRKAHDMMSLIAINYYCNTPLFTGYHLFHFPAICQTIVTFHPLLSINFGTLGWTSWCDSQNALFTSIVREKIKDNGRYKYKTLTPGRCTIETTAFDLRLDVLSLNASSSKKRKTIPTFLQLVGSLFFLPCRVTWTWTSGPLSGWIRTWN